MGVENAVQVEDNLKEGTKNESSSRGESPRVSTSQSVSEPTAERDRPASASTPKHARFYCLYAQVFTPLIALGFVVVLLLVVSIYTYFYLSTLWDPAQYLNKLPIAFLNQDEGFNFAVSNITEKRLLKMFHGSRKASSLIEFIFFNTTASSKLNFVKLDTNSSLESAVTLLENDDYWGLVFIPSNFSNTLLLNTAPSNQSTFYPTTIAYYFSQGRQMTVNGFALKIVQAIFQIIQDQYQQLIIKEATLNSTGTPITNLKFLALPINFNIINTHPVSKMGINFSCYLSAMILWISALLTTTLLFKVLKSRYHLIRYHESEGVLFKLRYLGMGLVMSLFFSFISALSYYFTLSILNGSLDLTTASPYTSISLLLFLWLQASTFTCMNCLLYFLLGPSFTPLSSFLMIIQLVTSNAILDPAVMPNGAKVTFGLPFYYAIRGVRCFILGAQCAQLGRDVNVLLIWLCLTISVCLILFFLRLTRNSSRRIHALNKSK